MYVVNVDYTFYCILQGVCSYLSKPLTPDVTLLSSVYEAVNMYYNYTGKASCLDINQEATQDLGTMGWDYQVYIFVFSKTTIEFEFNVMCVMLN